MRGRLAVLVTGLLLSPWMARAEPARFAMQAGYWGLGATAEHALAVQLELQPGVRWWWVRPTAGLLQSTDGTQFVFAGVRLEIPLVWGVTLSPAFAPGIRTVDGKRDFGSHLLFKTSVELGVPLLPGLRALASFAHMSNGKLAKPNPGIEMFLFGLEVDLE
ncbi:MAG: acyloxyacyl hydrolase [Myxococcaceae bacterium]|nr:MAG: acyloxyacyl hydrolase [Myxococcaceae bacterium]